MKAVSVIVIVKDDPGVVKTVQELLDHHSDIQKEIVVVVKTNGENSFDISNKQVKVIPYENSKKRITIPEQRNVGVKAATYDPIVFIDASCIPGPKWLDTLYGHFERGEKIVAGSVHIKGEKNAHTITGKKADAQYLEECPTANLLISKEVFEKVGYFDEHFEYGSDVELMWRSRDAGYKIIYSPESLITHDASNFQTEIQRSYNYGRARFRLYKKHFKKRKEYLVKKDNLVLIYATFILLSPITLIFPYYLFLLLIPLIKNRNVNPFKQTFLNLTFGWGVLTGFFT